MLLLEGEAHADQPIMLTEFGGIAFSRGHGAHLGLLARARPRRTSPSSYLHLLQRRARRCRCWPASATRSSPTPIRRPTACCTPTARRRFPIEHIALATRGPRTKRDYQIEWEWRERLMNNQRQQYVIPNEDHHTAMSPMTSHAER